MILRPLLCCYYAHCYDDIVPIVMIILCPLFDHIMRIVMLIWFYYAYDYDHIMPIIMIIQRNPIGLLMGLFASLLFLSDFDVFRRCCWTRLEQIMLTWIGLWHRILHLLTGRVRRNSYRIPMWFLQVPITLCFFDMFRRYHGVALKKLCILVYMWARFDDESHVLFLQDSYGMSLSFALRTLLFHHR